MKAAFYPVGQIDRASSRYRVFNIVGAHGSFVIGDGHNWQDMDAIVLQRAERHSGLAKKAKRAGKLVVYDLTDAWFYKHKWKTLWPGVAAMAKMAHCLTTSNQDDAEMLRGLFKKRVHVIPNAQPLSKHKRKHGNPRPPTIGWLGRENTMKDTLGTIWPTLSRLAMMGAHYRLLLINDAGSTRGLVLPYTEIVGMKWRLEKVYRQIANHCDIGICPQVRQSDGKFHKDENKFWTFQLCGVPCVSFARTKNWYDDLRRLILEPGHRKQQGEKGPSRAREVHPERVASYWHKVLSREAGKL